MNQVDIFTKQVGLALGPEWQFEERNDHWGELRTKEQQLSIQSARDPQKYHIALRLTEELKGHSPCSLSGHEEISLSKSKTPQQVAAEIRRRLLPLMEENVRASVLNLVKHNQAVERATQIASQLRGILPQLENDKSDEKSAMLKFSTPYSGEIQTTVEVDGYRSIRTVDISIGRISAEHAAAILSTINSLGILTQEVSDED